MDNLENSLEDTLQFEVNGTALEKFGERVTELLEKWLKEENELDVLVSKVSFDEIGYIVVDCVYIPGQIDKVRMLSEMFFKRLNINYTLE